MKNTGREPEKGEEASDHNAGLTPLKEKGKEGTWVASVSGCRARSR